MNSNPLSAVFETVETQQFVAEECRVLIPPAGFLCRGAQSKQFRSLIRRKVQVLDQLVHLLFTEDAAAGHDVRPVRGREPDGLAQGRDLDAQLVEPLLEADSEFPTSNSRG
ncbi:hypothetical protein IU443_21485 [Nocardia farcinica]|nr:hypothetical protein [Nocardia farcinica]MBF6392519.1 hypothetical protein [Nocardia farcinica]